MSSTPKEIIFEEAARDKLVTGIQKLSDTISHTLGPKGRNVGLEKSWGAPSITNDGNSITSEIELKDPYENMGAAMAKEVAAKLKEKCGDGSTTGIILLKALVEAGAKNIAAGASPISVKRGIDKGVTALVAEIEKTAITIKDAKEIRNIALVSASGDEAIGNLIADAMEQVGAEGVITIEEAKGTETTIEIVEGMQFDRGYLSPYFCSDSEKMTAELEKPMILLTDKKVTSIHDLLPILQTTASTGKELLIVAEDIEGDALSTLVVNRLRGTLKVTAVKAPGFGDRRKAMLEDLAVLTGATVISEETGTALKDVTVEALGSAERVTLTKEDTTIVNGSGSTDTIAARINQIEAEIEQTTSNYDKEKLVERRAKLSGGVAVIRVGAKTEPELKNRKQIFEDCLSSTQAALEEGIVLGAGVALLLASAVLNKLDVTDEERTGLHLLIKACEAPARQLIANAGLEESVVLDEIKQAGGKNGFNVLTEKVEDLLKAGVVDAAKVVKNCLTYAGSAAGIVLISEALITDAPEDDEEEQA